MIEKYLSPAGYHVDVIAALPEGEKGLSVLALQTKPDTDARRSQIHRSDAFKVDDDAAIMDVHHWVYSIATSARGELFAAHTHGMVQKYDGAEWKKAAELEANLTKLVRGPGNTLLALGLDGFIAVIDGSTVKEIPLPAPITLTSLSATESGAIFASGDSGVLYRWNENEWQKLPLETDLDIHDVHARNDDDVLLCGSNGLCGRLRGGTLETYEAPSERAFFAVTEFQERFYFGAGYQGVDRLEDGVVVSIKEAGKSFSLAANEHQLLMAGMNKMSRYDGEGWLQIPFL